MYVCGFCIWITHKTQEVMDSKSLWEQRGVAMKPISLTINVCLVLCSITYYSDVKNIRIVFINLF